MMWEDETGGDGDLGTLKPNAIIFLKVPAGEVKSRDYPLHCGPKQRSNF